MEIERGHHGEIRSICAHSDGEQLYQILWDGHADRFFDVRERVMKYMIKPLPAEIVYTDDADV